MEVNRCYGCMEEITAFPCPHCGYDPGSAGRNYALGPGTILNGKYLVGRVLGQGGFGITYIGWDLMLQRKVAIKEYYPSGQVMRQTGNSLQWYNTEQAQTARDSGREMFLKEARKMSRVCKIPQVVQVLDLFLQNDTAYIVMDFIEGETLKQRLKKTGPLSWQETQEIFLPVIQAMEQVHQAGLIHRDLSPDNLMLLSDGGVQILDLGAAKDLKLNSGASSMQVAKGGFSPLEQYIQQGGSGTWTDVYSMAATIYYTLTGVLPPSAVDRINRDTLRWDLPRLQDLPPKALRGLRKAMAIRAEDRTQTMQELYEAIAASQAAPQAKKKAVKDRPAAGKNESQKPERKEKKRSKKPLLFAAVLACAVIAAAVLLWKPAPTEKEAVTIESTEQTKATEAAVLSEEAIQYNQAAEWEADGQLGKAAIAFGKLGDYQDARERSFALWANITSRETLVSGCGFMGSGDTTSFGLKSDGTVVYDTSLNGQDYLDTVLEWTDIVAIRYCDRGLTLGLKSDGTVLAAGSNEYGQCDVSDWSDIVDIRADGFWKNDPAGKSKYYSVGLKADGTVVAAGNNEYGQCDVSDWTDIVAITTHTFREKAWGIRNDYLYSRTFGLKSDGSVVVTGENLDDWCDLSGWTDITAISVADYHVVGLKSDGTVVAVGGDPGISGVLPSRYDVSDWTDIIAIDTTYYNTLGLRSDGTIVAAGNQYIYGDLNVSDWENITAFAATGQNTLGLKADGTMVAVGMNRDGSCEVSGWTDIVAFSATDYLTIGLKSDGTVVVTLDKQDAPNWSDIKLPTKILPARNGKETKTEESMADQQAQYDAAEKLLAAGETAEAAIAFGKLGDYQDARERSFALWQEINKPETVSATESHTVGLKSDGTVVYEGYKFGHWQNIKAWTDLISVSAGGTHVAGLKSDGTVVTEGWDKAGQCDVTGWRDCVAVCAGNGLTVGVKSDGTVVAVGDNKYGQCDVSGWTDIVAISARNTHTAGLKTDGTVVAVGWNAYGQCDVSTWTDIVAVSAGGGHTVGLKTDGTVVAVGLNTNGQCDVSSWQDCAAISAGGGHTVGLKTDGTVVAVGDNKYGQCDVSGWTDIVAVSAGGGHTVGLKSDGTVIAVGTNTYGERNVSGWTDIKLPN